MSSRAVRGNAGILELNRACAETFPGSRLCTTLDYARTIDPPDLLDDAWIDPVPVWLGPNESGEQIYLADSVSQIVVKDGWPNRPTLNCRGWNGDAPGASGGMWIDSPDGWFPTPRSCTDTLKVACCSCGD